MLDSTQNGGTIDLDRRLAAAILAGQVAPDAPEPHAATAAILNEMGRHDAAIGAALVAVGLAPDHAHGQAELGRALLLAGDARSALEPCARAVALAPSNLGAMVNFGAVLFTLGALHEALDAAIEAVALDGNHYQARVNFALALEALGHLDAAEQQARRAIAIDPSPSARHNLAALLLSRGRLGPESWALYDARLELTPAARALAAIPRWSGEDLGAGTLLLHAEQGFGDVIQFVRFAASARRRAGRVVLAVPAALLRLLSGVEGVDEVVPLGRLPRFDAFAPLASLPGIFGTVLETIPAPIPYLAASPTARARFAPPEDGMLQVGLAWAGNAGFTHDHVRSIEPTRLVPLADLAGIRFHSLQKDGAPPFPMADRMGEMADFADTAGLIAGLDLVITVDTAIAHLAGALGKEIWLLSRFMGCWRWLRDRADSPWYPTMRIFRQERPNDWSGVIDDVRQALATRSERVG